MELLEDMKNVIKGGLINGPILYGTDKLLAVTDQAAYNMMPTLPAMARTPLVGLLLGTIPLALSDHWLAAKASEYVMANAVSSALTTAGAAPNVDSGPLDQQVNAMFLPIANLGLPANAVPFTAASFWGTPVPSTKGYVPAGQVTRGYVGGGPVQRPKVTAGYVPASGASTKPGMLGIRNTNRIRGLTTELR